MLDTATTGLREYVREIQSTLDSGIWMPALLSTLAIPDIAGAAEPVDPADPKPSTRWKRWYDRWVAPNYVMKELTGATVYKLRNSIIHEGVSFNRSAEGFDRVIFMPPNQNRIVIDRFLSVSADGSVVVEVYLTTFCAAFGQAALAWADEVDGDVDSGRRDRLSKLLQYRPNGIRPIIAGVGLIG